MYSCAIGLPTWKRVWRQWFWIDGTRPVLKTVRGGVVGAGFVPVIPVQAIPGRQGIRRILLRGGVWIGSHPVKRHVGDRERRRFVKVHVFHVAVGVEEVIALPAGRQGWHRRRAEFRINIFPVPKITKWLSVFVNKEVTSP